MATVFQDNAVVSEARTTAVYLHTQYVKFASMDVYMYYFVIFSKRCSLQEEFFMKIIL